ncbi:MAG: hypothetical protein E6X49_18505 [Leclercia adecarboxylata]|nr:hypothetical protein [uncultured Leclercia sp.]MDU4843114.1 hypothetical protein [Leclercia adecarboxylata]
MLKENMFNITDSDFIMKNSQKSALQRYTYSDKTLIFYDPGMSLHALSNTSALSSAVRFKVRPIKRIAESTSYYGHTTLSASSGQGLTFFSSPALTAKRLRTTLIAKLANKVFPLLLFMLMRSAAPFL